MECAKRGAKVVVSSRNQEAVDAVAEEIKQSGGIAAAIACKVGDADSMNRLMDFTIRTFGRIDVLVNNAAVNPVYGPIHETGPEAFDKIMEVNVKGPFLLSNLALPYMKEAGGGSIIHISSIGGITPEPHLGVYSVSKAALNMLAKAQAAEWGKFNIRVNVVCPGLIKTKFSKALWANDKTFEQYNRQVPLGRIAEPEEVAGLIAFLAGDGSSYCTGGIYTVDGGHTI